MKNALKTFEKEIESTFRLPGANQVIGFSSIHLFGLKFNLSCGNSGSYFSCNIGVVIDTVFEIFALGESFVLHRVQVLGNE